MASAATSSTPREPPASKAKSKGGEKHSALPKNASTHTLGIPVPVLKKESVDGNHWKKEVEYYTDELLAREPLDAASRDALVKRAGEPRGMVRSVRVEGKRPPGRLDENQGSRHERVPPAAAVLMFNWYE